MCCLDQVDGTLQHNKKDPFPRSSSDKNYPILNKRHENRFENTTARPPLQPSIRGWLIKEYPLGQSSIRDVWYADCCQVSVRNKKKSRFLDCIKSCLVRWRTEHPQTQPISGDGETVGLIHESHVAHSPTG